MELVLVYLVLLEKIALAEHATIAPGLTSLDALVMELVFVRLDLMVQTVLA